MTLMPRQNTTFDPADILVSHCPGCDMWHVMAFDADARVWNLASAYTQAEAEADAEVCRVEAALS
jgi:hypothetical protein